MSTQNIKTPATQSRRWRWLGGVLGTVLAIGLGYTIYWAQVLRYHQTTDDAYVSGNVVQITPQISGTVVAIGADDTQFVKAGQALVRLDQSDAKVALDQAEAQLARTVRDVRNLFATSSGLEASVQLRQTDLAAAQRDLERREHLGATGAVSGEELKHARDAVKAAESSLQVARSSSPPTARGWTTRPSRIIRRCAMPPPRCAMPTSRCRARNCRPRSPASSPAATYSSASAWVQARP